MKPRRSSNLPLLLLLLFPLAHVLAIGATLAEDQKSGFWSIGATVLFLMDGLLSTVLILVLYTSMRWKTRERWLVALTAFQVLFGGIFLAMGDTKQSGLALLATNGVPLLAVVLAWVWASRQPGLRDR